MLPDLTRWTSSDAPKGWKPLLVSSGPMHQRWLGVKDKRVGPAIRVKTIHEADEWVNRLIAYKEDSGDSWQSPIQTLAHLAGDCEDFALLKRAVLLNSDVPEDHLVLLVVYDRIRRRDHAVLWCWCKAHGGHVLDQANSLTLSTAEVKDYTPIQAFQGDKSWVYGRVR